MTSEARIKELASMLANHPFLALAVDEINRLEEEAAELRERIESLEGAVGEATNLLPILYAYMKNSPRSDIGDWCRTVLDECLAALSPANAQAKLETRSGKEE